MVPESQNITCNYINGDVYLKYAFNIRHPFINQFTSLVAHFRILRHSFAFKNPWQSKHFKDVPK